MDSQFPLTGSHEGGGNAEESRLTRSVAAENCHELATTHIQRDACQGRETAESFADIHGLKSRFGSGHLQFSARFQALPNETVGGKAAADFADFTPRNP
jgi:hypothetical protein